MLKGNCAIDMSESVLFDEDNIIDNQNTYIHGLFDDKFQSYQEKLKSIVDSICTLMNGVSLADLKIIIKMAESKMNESVGFDSTVELPF